jgi:D-alanine-D-alanine ligase
MKKMTIALLSGGASSEREVSLNGGDQVYQALDREKYTVVRYDPKTDLPKLVADAPGIDAAVVILHGPYGEDGTIQGLLDLLGIPYQGSGVLGSATAMNKLTSKKLYEKAGLPVPRYVALRKGQAFEPEVIQGELRLPLVVKPVSCGSSIGMSIVRTPEDFPDAVEKAFEYDADILVEAYIDGVELTGGVIGNDDPEALPLIEIIPKDGHDFFDYEAKYVAGQTEEICPARVDDAITRKAQSFARIAHDALFCKGYSRTDMILKGRHLYVLETNTIPGMTSTSLFPQAAAAAGLDFSALMDRLIDLGIEAKKQSVI